MLKKGLKHYKVHSTHFEYYTVPFHIQLVWCVLFKTTIQQRTRATVSGPPPHIQGFLVHYLTRTLIKMFSLKQKNEHLQPISEC